MKAAELSPEKSRLEYLPPQESSPLKLIGDYRRVFRNYLVVLLRKRLGLFPITAVLKDGRTLNLVNRDQTFWAMRFESWGWHFDSDSGAVSIPTGPPLGNIVFFGADQNGDLEGIFRRGDYSSLDVVDRTVIDIGASIGDSSIYFAARGARRVLAFEPFPTAFTFAMRNVQVNGQTDRIAVVRAACCGAIGQIGIEGSRHSTTSVSTASAPGIEPTPTVSLTAIVDKYRLSHAVLKVDCEGCEYEIFDSTESGVLSCFDQILIEYHFGLGNLTEILGEAGFSVEFTTPYRLDLVGLSRPMHIGWIRGRRTSVV